MRVGCGTWGGARGGVNGSDDDYSATHYSEAQHPMQEREKFKGEQEVQCPM